MGPSFPPDDWAPPTPEFVRRLVHWKWMSEFHDTNEGSVHRTPLEAILNAAEELVHAAGGETLAGQCRPRIITDLKNQGDDTPETCGCGSRQSRVTVPYKRDGGEDAYAVLCGVCDSLHQTPRFKPKALA